ncbi:pyruvate dehydrogenase complex dihydrolipoamide acetyltransferase [Acetobacteraceae bacterium KSS8]|uniref:Acetyltransferase component of pyruvate dehydrogenase complex n=1 Tax=Endosaccharibacter trunci TaxID=2812733 RepID=A0ABT1W394_9PROT|nr:pyruvate dehydrogenase complex dihydrolipoamide acetyltransferase [Acetobacteraceae bacterium KSS8]
MPTNILMPALSPTMTEGTLARWLKKEGDRVSSGDVIAEIETDKATMEVEAVDEGILGRILIADGTENVAINTPIGVLVNEGEAVPDSAAPAAAAKPDAAPASQAQTAQSQTSQAGAPKADASAAAPKAGTAAPVPAPATGKRIVASPLARRLAKEAGIDLAGVTGSGPNGRIVRADLEKAKAAPASRPASAAAPAPARTGPSPMAPITAPHRVVPNNGVRRVIARRLSESKQFVPHFYVTIDVEMDALLALRTQLNAQSPEGEGSFKLSVNDMLIKACAVTLKRVPKVNATYTDEAILEYEDVDISVAVSAPGGLITPIVRSAEKKTLAQISHEARGLIKRAREGKLKPEEFQGGGFSISNMGMFGVKQFAAIINPPQSGILAVSASEKRAVVRSDAKGDRLEIATVMTATLSVDHRAVDGALAAEWVQAFKTVVENPLSLVI